MPTTNAKVSEWRSKKRAKKLGRALSKSQAKVLDLLCQGHTVKEIAGRLGIAINTSEAHVYEVYSKLGVRTRAELLLKVLLDQTPIYKDTRQEPQFVTLLGRIIRLEGKIDYLIEVLLKSLRPGV